MRKVRIGIEIGYELRTIDISSKQWEDIKKGIEFQKTEKDYYEGEEFEYHFHFNDPNGEYSFVVSINDEYGTGYVGDIDDVEVFENN